MARIPRYHQEQLRTLEQPNPGVDTSALQVGNNLLQNTGALAQDINQSNAHAQHAVSEVLGSAIGALLQHHAIANQAARQQTQLFQDSLVSTNAAMVGLAQNDLVKQSIAMSPDDLEAGSKFYRQNASSVVKSTLDELKISDPVVRTKVMEKAQQRFVSDDKQITDARLTNGKTIVDAQVSNAATKISTQMSTFTGNDSGQKTLVDGLKALDDLKPALYNSHGAAVGEEKLNKLKTDAVNGYANRLIDQDPTAFKQLMDSGAFSKPGGVNIGAPAPDGSQAKVDTPVLEGKALEQLQTRYEQRVNAIDAENKVTDAATTLSQKQDVNMLYATATGPNITPVEKDKAVAMLYGFIDHQLSLPKEAPPGNERRDEQALNFAIERRDQLEARKTESEKAADQKRAADNLARALTNQQRADQSHAEQEANKKELARKALPANLTTRMDAETAFKTAYTNEKVDVGTKISQIDKAMAMNDKAHSDKLITDDVWLYRGSALQMKQQDAVSRLTKPPTGIKGFARQTFGKPEEQYYDAVSAGVPNDLLKAKGALGDSVKTLEYNTLFTRTMIKTVEQFKKDHDGQLPSKNGLEDAKQQTIKWIKENH